MAKLKLDDATLQRFLDILDAQDAVSNSTAPPRFRYRSRVRLDIETGRDACTTWTAPCRRIGHDGVYLVVGSVVNLGSRCRVDLITIQNSWQTVAGTVEECRYIPGTTSIHELFVRFDHLVDPASFAPTAVQARILVADDSATARRLLVAMLKPLNADITEVEDGAAAVKAALADPFDIILMDLEMPEMGGLDAVRMLRSKGYIRPVVAITALTEAEDRARCLETGFDDYLPKPPHRDELAKVVHRARPEPLVSSLLHEPEMIELIDSFVQQLPERIARLEAAFGSQDLKELAVETRVLKGEAGGYGFDPITVAAVVLERALREEAGLAEVRQRLSGLVRLCLAARPATVSAAPPGKGAPAMARTV
jgi:CheY-like chemotaxis protein